MADLPSGRKKNVSGTGSDVHKKDSGLGTGPVGQNSGSNQIRHDNKRPSGGSGSSSGGSSGGGVPSRAIGGGTGILILIVLFFLIKSGGLGSLFGGGNSTQPATQATQPQTNNTINYNLSGSSLFSGWGSTTASTNTGTSSVSPVSSSTVSSNSASNKKKLDTSVASGSRSKYTTIKGNGKDTVTLMVYMCGTDLESSYSMATKDLQEMASASISDKLNIIIYTGGCKKWQISNISTTKNQVWKLTNGSLTKLAEENARSMVQPSTLSDFIKFCASNYPADRYEIILWDHGGGSITGYGYDEKYPNGSMSLEGLKKAFTDGGVKFDFIGFDACLMATTETALTMAEFGDYMIASEESEPGIGWYYTNWVNQLSKNTSVSTLELGKTIVDDFVTVCGQQCRGQKATLSVVDLAEAANTIPAALKNFATSTSNLIKNKNYAQVSNARSGAREFAVSSRIDQVDLVDLCNGMNTTEAAALAKAIRGAVKYNNTSSDMTNAYGLSIYFPYKNVRTVDTAVKTFKAVGIDADYRDCIQQVAAMSTSGQAISGGSSSALSSLLSGYSGGGTTASSSSDILSILGGLMGGSSTYNVSGLSGSAMDFLSSALSGGRALNIDDTAAYLNENRFDPDQLVWKKADGRYAITMDQANWSLVQDIRLNIFVDDGAGYIDLGLDSIFDLTEDGRLLAEEENSWIYMGDKTAAKETYQPMAYYYTDSNNENGKITYYGYTPALLTDLNLGLLDQRVELKLSYNDTDGWQIVGFRPVYTNGETDAVAKDAREEESTALSEGAQLQFIADYYDYSGNYQDTYKIGDPVKVTKNTEIVDLAIPSSTKCSVAYVLTDIYQQEYWTPVVPK